MKNTLSAILAICLSSSSYAQSKQALTLVPEKVKAGKPVRIVYQPSAESGLQGRDSVSCEIRRSYNVKYATGVGISNIKMLAKDGRYEGEYTPSDSIVMLSFSFYDPSNPKKRDSKLNYHRLIYQKSGKPVAGALVAEAQLLAAKLEESSQQVDSLFNLEYKLYRSSHKNLSILTAHYYAKESSGDTVALKTLVNQIEERLKDTENKDEQGQTSAYYILYNSKKQQEAEALKQRTIEDFPKGTFAKRKLIDDIRQAKDSVAVEKLYEQAKDIFGASADPYLNYVANAFASKGYLPAVRELGIREGSLEIRSSIYNSYAWNRVEAGKDLDSALFYSQQSLDLLDKVKTELSKDKLDKSADIKQLNQSVQMYLDTYAYILYKLGRVDEALTYQQKAIDAFSNPNDAIKERYALLLFKNKHLPEAKLMAEQVYQKKQTKGRTALLKDIFREEKGSEDGFREYAGDLVAKAEQVKKDLVAQEMLNVKAPAFAMKTLNGDTVSLSSLKGKIVVLDFWATWCGPCVASFPGMVAAQEKFAKNNDVVFLFVNTWENKPKAARKFIADNKYPFNVVMDNFENEVYSTAVDYEIKGIPTKIIIDRDGNIRFRMVGYSGSVDKTLQEISERLELLSKK